MAIPQHGKKHPLSGQGSPVILGHEFYDRIVQAPEGSGLETGQAVMADPRYWCDSCPGCDRATNLCEIHGFYGLSGGGGGFSEYVAIPFRNLIPLPEKAPLHLAALIEPLTVAWHGVKRAGVRANAQTSALVLGGGPIGLAVLIVLKSHGWRNLCVSEPSTIRRARAQQYSDLVIDPICEKGSDRVLSFTGGKGVDVVFDCAGIQAGMDAGCASLALYGVYQNLARWTNAVITHFT